MTRLLTTCLTAVLTGGCGACFDLTTPRGFACDPAVAEPSACPGGFRCGAAGRCFDPDAGEALRCTASPGAAVGQNPQCPDRWACGVGGSCVDVREDTIVAPQLSAPSPELLSPLLAPGSMLDSTLSPVTRTSPSTAESTAMLISGEDATLAVVRSAFDGEGGRFNFDVRVSRAMLPAGASGAVLWTQNLGGQTQVTVAALTDGGLGLLATDGRPWRSLPLPRPATRLRALQGATADTALLAVTFADGSAELRPVGDLASAVPLQLPGGAAPIFDVLAMEQVGADGGSCRALVATAGSQLCTAAFESVKGGSPTFRCAPAGILNTPLQLQELRPRDRGASEAQPAAWFAARAVVAGKEGTQSLQAFRLRAQGEACVDAPALDRGLAVEDLCPGAAGGRPKDFRAIPTAGTARLERLCSSEDYDISVLDDGSSAVVATQSAPPRPGEGVAVFSSRVRGVSYGVDSRSRVPLEPTFDPDLLLRAGVFASSAALEERLLAQLGGALFVEVPDAGMLLGSLSAGEDTVTAVVENAKDTFVLASGLVASQSRDAGPDILAFDAEPLADPARVRAIRVGDTLVVTRGEALLSARLADQAQPLEVRLKPQPGVDVVALAFRKETDGGLPSGYVVAGGRAFAVRSRSERSWTSSAVELGEVEVQRVWLDRGRGRAGTVDGRVLSLEGRVDLMPRLPAEAIDWAAPCGVPWALTSAGLYRAVGSPAQWEEVPVELTMPGLSEVEDPGERFRRAGLEAGRLFLVGNDVVVAGAFGQLVRYRGPTQCP